MKFMRGGVTGTGAGLWIFGQADCNRCFIPLGKFKPKLNQKKKKKNAAEPGVWSWKCLIHLRMIGIFGSYERFHTGMKSRRVERNFDVEIVSKIKSLFGAKRLI